MFFGKCIIRPEFIPVLAEVHTYFVRKIGSSVCEVHYVWTEKFISMLICRFCLVVCKFFHGGKALARARISFHVWIDFAAGWF
jgi:hypothetical protein